MKNLACLGMKQYQEGDWRRLVPEEMGQVAKVCREQGARWREQHVPRFSHEVKHLGMWNSPGNIFLWLPLPPAQASNSSKRQLFWYL